MHLNVNVINVNTFCCSTFLSICEPFIEGHQIKAMFPNDRARRANKPLGIAYVDVFGRMKVVVFMMIVQLVKVIWKCPSGINEAPMVVKVAKSSKSPSFDIGEDIVEHEGRVENNLVAFSEPRGDQQIKCVFQHF